MSALREREFEELSNNVRHWEQMRWVSMTIFIAIMGGALTAFSTWQHVLDALHLVMFKILSLSLVLIFWIQDERIVAYWKATKRRAHEIEEQEGIRVFSITPRRGFFSAGTAVRILYLLFLLLWVILLVT